MIYPGEGHASSLLMEERWAELLHYMGSIDARHLEIEKRLTNIESRQVNIEERIDRHSKEDHEEFRQFVQMFKNSKAAVRIIIAGLVGLSTAFAALYAAFDWVNKHFTVSVK